jgi:hypothetical protein
MAAATEKVGLWAAVVVVVEAGRSAPLPHTHSKEHVNLE